MNYDRSLLGRMKQVFDIARSITHLPDMDAALAKINEAAARLLDADASSILLLDPSKKKLVFTTACGDRRDAVEMLSVRIGEGIAGTVARKHAGLIVNNAAQDRRFSRAVDRVTGIATRSVVCVPLFNENEFIGVVEVINKRSPAGFTDDDLELLESLAALAAGSIANARLHEDQHNFFANTMEMVISAIESKSSKLSGHSFRVAHAATTIGRCMGIRGPEYRNLYYGALLHDVGFITMIDQLSIGGGKMVIKTNDIVTRHPDLGANMVRSINLLSGAEPVIRYHHEHFDGSGFPHGKKGDAIPLPARIVAVAEAAEEMSLSGYAEDKTHRLLRLGQGNKYDPQVIDIYIQELFGAKE